MVELLEERLVKLLQDFPMKILKKIGESHIIIPCEASIETRVETSGRVFSGTNFPVKLIGVYLLQILEEFLVDLPTEILSGSRK